MKIYELKIIDEALIDIKDATDWYNNKINGLGVQFQTQVIKQIESLKLNAANNSIRFYNVRCLVVKKFPFVIHYKLDEEIMLIEIFAVFHTSRNPKIWEKRILK